MNLQAHTTHAGQTRLSTTTAAQRSGSKQQAQAPQPDYLDLHGIRTLSEPRCEDFCIMVEAEQTWHQKCPNCGCESKQFKPNGTRRQTVRDEPRGIKSVKILLRRRSYKCLACRKSGLLPLDSIIQRRAITGRLLDYIEKESLQRPFRELAEEIGLSPRTVRDMFDGHVAKCEENAVITIPRVLGIDGVYVERKERAILTDIEQGEVVDLWETVKKEELTLKLKELSGREKIRVVVMDMSRALKGAVEEALPHAVVVIDRYHIQRMANKALDKVRNRLRPRGQRKNQATMIKSEILGKHLHDLTAHEKREMEKWFGVKPELGAAYDLKEQFYAIWHTHSRATAEKSYSRWLQSIPPGLMKDFQKLKTAMSRWGKYIFNYFDYPYTNAFTESKNRQIKDIQRESRNGRFKTIRAKAIYGMSVKKLLREARGRQTRAASTRTGKAGGVLVREEIQERDEPDSIQLSLF